MKEEKIDPLFEWAVWGHLQSKTDLELILLKGHLMLEIALETCLKRSGLEGIDNYSFHKKINELNNCIPIDTLNKTLIINFLYQINKLRNKLAHEVEFDINDLQLQNWSIEIISRLKGKKWSKFTFRTRIVHAFSILAINILELK